MNLKDTFELLISGDDKPLSRYARAVRLFEFEVSIFYANSFKRLIRNPSSATAPTGVLKTARILAISKILEQIERQLTQQRSISAVSLRDLAGDQVYQDIFDQLFVPNGGWNQILSSRPAKSFDKSIERRRGLAKTAANIVDFSYRFSKEPPPSKANRRKNLGGLETAKYVVRKSYLPTASESTIKSRWKDYKSSAICLYLILHQNFKLVPPKLRSGEFVDELFEQADNLDELKRFFSAYATVHAALSNLKFELPQLDLAKGHQPTQLNVDELSPKIRDSLSEWISLIGPHRVSTSRAAR